MDFKNSNFSSQLAKPPKARRKMEICFFLLYVGIKLSVEEGTTSANAETITSSPHSKSVSSSLSRLDTSKHKTTSQGYGDGQIAKTSFSSATTETNDQVSGNDDAFKKVRSNIEEGDPSQIDEDLSSSLVVTKELENLVSKNHLAVENLSLLTDFLVKHPSVLKRDRSLSNRYKGYAYNCLAELLKFLQRHNVLDVLGSSHSEFVEILQDVRRFPFDKEWLDGVEKVVGLKTHID